MKIGIATMMSSSTKLRPVMAWSRPNFLPSMAASSEPLVMARFLLNIIRLPPFLQWDKIQDLRT